MTIVPLAFAGLLAISAEQVVASVQPPGNFAFRLVFGCSTLDEINQYQHAYIRDIGREYDIHRTWLSFSPEQKAELFKMVVDAKFFDYPTRFKPAQRRVVEPATRYELKVRSGRQEHTVTWNDPGLEYGSTLPEAIRLRALIQRIIEMALEDPRVSDLPPTTQICL